MLSNRNFGISVALFSGIFAFLINKTLNNFELFSPGSATIAFLIGIICSIFIKGLDEGGKWCTRNLMPVIIVFLGFGLNLRLLTEPEIGLLGATTVFFTVLTCFSISYVLGKIFKLELTTSIALGAGSAICGNSAVVAIAPSLKMKEENIALVLAVINLLCLATFILIPIIAIELGMNQIEAGIWAGSVIHAVPQTIASGEAIGDQGLIIATAVKLSRVALLIVVVPICVYLGNKIHDEDENFQNKMKIPYFIPGFLISAVMSTWFLPESTVSFFVEFGKYLLFPMMAAVGFFINLDNIQSSAKLVFLSGIIITLSMALGNLFIIKLF